MRTNLIISFFILFNTIAFAESPMPIPLSSPIIGCSSPVAHVLIYRCVCRVDLAAVSGSSQVSYPLTLTNGLTYIYSATNLTNTPCSGTIRPDVCNPAALNGATVNGKYSCALGNTTESGFEIP